MTIGNIIITEAMNYDTDLMQVHAGSASLCLAVSIGIAIHGVCMFYSYNYHTRSLVYHAILIYQDFVGISLH